MNYKIEGIVLRSRDIKQYDRIYSVFSRQLGKINVLAVGARKPTAKLASGLEPITKSEIFLVSGKWMDRATGVIIADQYSNIKKNENRLLEIRLLFNVLDIIANEKEKNEQIFNDLDYFLKIAEKNTISPEKISLLKLGLVWKMIVWSGFSPNLQKCRNCGQGIFKGRKIIFSIPGGIICQDCHKKEQSGKAISSGLAIMEDSVKILRIFLSNKYAVVEKLVARKEVISEVGRLTGKILENLFEKKIPI